MQSLPRPGTVRCAGYQETELFALGNVLVGMKGAAKTSLVKKMANDAMALGEPMYFIDTGDRWVSHCKHFAPPGTAVRRINVTKRGGLGLDFAAVCRTALRIAAFVKKLVPDLKNDQNPFFRGNAKLVITAAILVLNLFAPGRWTLADLIWLACHPKLLSALCRATKGQVADPYADFDGTNGSRDVAATVNMLLKPIGVFANLSERAEATVSPLVGIEEGGVTVLEWSDNLSAALETVLAFTAEVVHDELLSRQTKSRVWCCWDEIASLQPLDSIPALARRGRRSAACLVFTMHEIEDLIFRYGRERALSMLNLMGTKVFLRIGGEETAKWAAGCLGRGEFITDIDQPPPAGAPLNDKGQPRKVTNRSVVEVYNVTPDMLRSLPYPDIEKDKIVGYVSNPKTRAKFNCPFLKDVVIPDSPEPEDVPDDWQDTRPRTRRDLARLNLPQNDAVIEALEGKS